MENTYVDQTITCRDCGKEFVFEAGEHKHFVEVLHFDNIPTRCKECRDKRKSEKNYNNDNQNNQVEAVNR